MAIFSRRTIQRLINENVSFLRKTQVKKHLDLINLNKKEYEKLLESGKNTNDLIETYINTEWEIVLLNSLSKFGEIRHERKIGTSEPDISYVAYENDFEFVGDVTCITGKQDKDNISLAFKNELKEIIDVQHPSGYWEVFLRGNSREMDFCNAKPRLMLEGKSQWNEIFSSNQFIEFIERIKKNPVVKDCFNYKKSRENPEILLPNQIDMYRNILVDIEIRYEPRSFYQVEYRQFDDRKIVKIEKDEIYKSLLKKYNQLIKTQHIGCLGIFLCDGTGNTFNRRDSLHSNSTDVINSFLSHYREIDFVVTLTSQTKPYNFFDSNAEITIGLFKGYESNLSLETIQWFENNLVKAFPKPARTVTNARNSLNFNFTKKKKIVSFDGGGLEVSSDKIKVSSRTLLELLAGKLCLEDISYYLGFDSHTSSIPNTFLMMLQDGKLFKDVTIEKGENEKDDDWIVFSFKDADVAVSPFKMPDIY